MDYMNQNASQVALKCQPTKQSLTCPHTLVTLYLKAVFQESLLMLVTVSVILSVMTGITSA